MWVALNISDVTLLEDDAVENKLSVEFSEHGHSHVGLQVIDLSQPDGVDKVTDILLYFCSQEFIKSSSSQLVNESLDLIFVLWESEGEMNINIDISVILGWASVDWSIVVNNVFCYHTGDSTVTGVAPLGSWVHDAFGCTPIFLQNDEVGWDIKLKITAAASVTLLDHANDALVVGVSGTSHLGGSFIETSGRDLDDS